MTGYVALLRAVNVGGTGKLPMADLREMCVALGFDGVRTYIASGNVVFSTGLSEAEVKKALEERLRAYAGKPVGVMVGAGAFTKSSERVMTMGFTSVVSSNDMVSTASPTSPPLMSNVT